MDEVRPSPALIAHELDTTPWGELGVNGVILGIFCPRCNALIAHTEGSMGFTGREHHTNWHVASGF